MQLCLRTGRSTHTHVGMQRILLCAHLFHIYYNNEWTIATTNICWVAIIGHNCSVSYKWGLGSLSARCSCPINPLADVVEPPHVSTCQVRGSEPWPSHTNKTLRQTTSGRALKHRPRIIQYVDALPSGTCFTRHHSTFGSQPIQMSMKQSSLVCDRQWLFWYPLDRLTVIATRAPCLEVGFWIHCVHRNQDNSG